MSMSQINQIHAGEAAKESTHLLGSLKNMFSEIFSSGESSQERALSLLQDSRGFDPVSNPQSLVAPRRSLRERTPDKRLPVRKAA